MSTELEQFDDNSLTKADVQAEGAVKAVSFNIDVFLDLPELSIDNDERFCVADLSFDVDVFLGVDEFSFDVDILFGIPNEPSTFVIGDLFGIVEVSFVVVVLFGIVETSYDPDVRFIGVDVDGEDSGGSVAADVVATCWYKLKKKKHFTKTF